MLEQYGVSLKSLNLEKLEREISELESRKKELSSDYKTLAKSEKDVRKQVEKLNGYLDVERKKDVPRKDGHLL